MSLGAAADFLRRQKALAQELAAASADQPATTPAALPIVVDKGGVKPRDE